jgi:hypothetical protein
MTISAPAVAEVGVDRVSVTEISVAKRCVAEAGSSQPGCA